MGGKRYTPSNLKAASLSVTGLEEYLQKIQSAGENVDAAVKKAIEKSAEPIRNDIEAWAQKHKRSGTTLKGVDMSPIKQDGNYIYADVGISTEQSEHAWHAVFVEYGTPTNAADPGIRTAFENNLSKVKKIQRDILKKEGMPVD